MTHTEAEALKRAKKWFEAHTYGDEAVEVYEAIEQALAAQPAPVQDTEAHYKGVVEGVQKLFDDKRTQPAVQEPDAMGCKCSICGEWQRWTPSGMACKNGHGGARGINHRLYTTPPAPAVPDAITDDSESPEYRTGWNDCRQAMMEMMK
jgi:hypothetical protein